MALNCGQLMRLPPMVQRHRYTVRDTILYALGVGAGLGDPTDPEVLRYCYEAGLEPLPTMAVTLGYPGFWLKDPKHGVNWRRMLHGDQALTLHRPLPVAADVVGVTRVVAIYDKGADKGAVLYTNREVRLADGGELLASVRHGSFLRADGGFGGSSEGAPRPHPTPDRPPDWVLDMPTRPEQALLYRLCGDDNPLHADPSVGREAGFEGPILHGLCSYGLAARAVIRLLCGGEPSRLKQVDCRFSAPVYPGETLRVEVWSEPAGGAFRARVVERDVMALQNGYVEVRPG